MKKTSKIFSVVLALVLVFAMTVPAFAAGEGSIKINNAISGQTYTIYKMFDFTPITGGNAESEKGFYTVAEDSKWNDFITGDGAAYLEKDNKNGTIVFIGTDDQKAALAKAAIAYAKKNSISATDAKTASGATVEFTGLDLGYYAIDTSLGTVCGLSNTNTKFVAHEKNKAPTLTKEVKEDSSSDWGAWNDAEIGDKVEFKITVNAKVNASGYVVHDTMENGLTFNNDIAIEGLTLDTDYTVSTSCSDGCDFEITIKDTYLDTLTEDKDIVITYSATLNNNAEIVTDTNDNTAWLAYGDNATVTAEAKTQTLTYYFDLTKTDVNGVQLEGAEFTLSNEDGVMSFVATADGYRVATAEDTNTTTEIVVGKARISGLDADTYTLEETKAPKDYNLLDETIDVTVDEATVGATVTFTAEDLKVENKTGSLLPETGGMGTTLFYIVGAFLVVAAVVLLVVKKRMSAEA